MKRIPAAPGRAVGFARSPPAGAFAGFVLSLSLISRPPPFSACRTAFPARRRRRPSSGRSTAPYRCCPRSGGCRCRRKDPADPANRMNRSDQSNRLALRFPLQGWLQSAHIHRPHSRALWNPLQSRWPLWLLSNRRRYGLPHSAFHRRSIPASAGFCHISTFHHGCRAHARSPG